MSSVTLSFSVDAEECKDIIGYYDKLPKGHKSREFVRVHKMHMQNAGVTLADLNAKLDRILDLLAAGVPLGTSAAASSPSESGESGESKADLSQLDGLGL